MLDIDRSFLNLIMHRMLLESHYYNLSFTQAYIYQDIEGLTSGR